MWATSFHFSPSGKSGSQGGWSNGSFLNKFWFPCQKLPPCTKKHIYIAKPAVSTLFEIVWAVYSCVIPQAQLQARMLMSFPASIPCQSCPMAAVGLRRHPPQLHQRKRWKQPRSSWENQCLHHLRAVTLPLRPLPPARLNPSPPGPRSKLAGPRKLAWWWKSVSWRKLLSGGSSKKSGWLGCLQRFQCQVWGRSWYILQFCLRRVVRAGMDPKFLGRLVRQSLRASWSHYLIQIADLFFWCRCLESPRSSIRKAYRWDEWFVWDVAAHFLKMCRQDDVYNQYVLCQMLTHCLILAARLA